MLTIQDAVNLSHSKMQGQLLAPHQEQSLTTFMQLPQHLDMILPAAMRDPIFMSCYKAYTQRARREGYYFTTSQDPAKSIVHMLSIVCGAPDNISRHESNLYLSLQGELLAQLIQIRHPTDYFTCFFKRVLNTSAVDEIKYYYALKILASCLGQVADQNATTKTSAIGTARTVIFATYYAPVLAPFINLLAETIDAQFDFLYDPISLIANLHQTQHNFFAAMRRDLDNEELKETSFYPAKLKIKPWEKSLLMLWTKWNCRMVIKIIRALQGQYSNVKTTTPQSASVTCTCLNIASNIYRLSFEEDQSILDRDQFYQPICQIIISELLAIFFHNCNFQKSIPITNMPPQFHVSILRMITENPGVLKKLMMQISNQNTFYVPLQGYITFIISKYQIDFTDFLYCPVGLAVKLMYMIIQHSIEIKRSNCNKPEQVQVFSIKANGLYKALFTSFLFCKLVLHKIENQSLYEEEKNWPNYVADTLNAYFEDLIRFFPKPFLHEEISEGQLELQPKFRIQRSSFYVFTELEEINRVPKMDELCKQFEKEPVFEMLCIMFQQLPFESAENWMKIKSWSQENAQWGEILEQLIFGNILPKLSCFVTIIRHVQNYQIKAFFFYQLYKSCKEMKVGQYNCFPNKVRACKLFMIQAFLEEIVRDQFTTYGQEDSITFAFMSKELGVNFKELMNEVALQIAQCVRPANDQESDAAQIVDYGLSILSRLCRLLTERVGYLRDQHYYEFDDSFSAYNSLLFTTFQTVKSLRIQCPVAYRKLFMIGGYFINLNGITVLYNFYQKLQEETLAQINLNGEQENTQLIVQKYLSGVTGILEALYRSQVFRAAAQLFLSDIYYLKSKGLFIVDDDLMEIEVDFLNCLICEKVYGEPQQSIGLTVHDLFANDLNELLDLASDTEYQKKCINLFRKMALTNSIQLLVQIPTSFNLLPYPEVLSQYFYQLPRVSNLKILEPYACSRIDWLLSFIEEKLQRNEKFEYEIEKTFLNFRGEKQAKIQQLIVDTSKLTLQPVQELKERIKAQYKWFDSMLQQADEV